MFDLNRRNIVRIAMMVLVSILGIYVIWQGAWYMGLLAVGAMVLDFLMLSHDQWMPSGRAEAYALTYRHADGKFFHLLDPRDLPSSAIGTETWYDGDAKAYWPYWMPGRNGMTDILVLDPAVGSPKRSMVHDYINTNTEFRNIGQFRSYFRTHTERKGRETSLDMLRGYSPTISFSRPQRHPQRPEREEEESGLEED